MTGPKDIPVSDEAERDGPQYARYIGELEDVHEKKIDWSSIYRVLKRLHEALHLFEDLEGMPNELLSLHHWLETLTSFPLDDVFRCRVQFAIAVAFTLHCGQRNLDITPTELKLVWLSIKGGLIHTPIASTIARSAQGFLAVPLWSDMKDGRIQELLRLHVWLPDGHRIEQFEIHAHQPFIQSWILAGEGRDFTYKTEPSDFDNATHAEYGVSWADSSGNDSGSHYQRYKVHQKYSIIKNTGKLVRAFETESKINTRHTTYNIPAGVFHRSVVEPDSFHATLCFFDSSRGFEQIAPVLGPKDATSYTQQRGVTTSTPVELAETVQVFRMWEDLWLRGLEHTYTAEWEEALRAFDGALAISQQRPEFPETIRYKHALLSEIGHMNRMLGRNKQASLALEEALRNMPINKQYMKTTGELAVVYRHMGRLREAKHACEEQYRTAKHIGSQRGMSRAIGNLGMINYQLFLANHDNSFLDLAIAQLQERIDSSRTLRDSAVKQLTEPKAITRALHDATVHEAIGLARLSLCLIEKGDIVQAIKVSCEALEATLTTGDSTKAAFSRYFYGKALLLGGRREEALQQFNPLNACTPVIALCKEPSDEHRDYIREMIATDADLDLRDEQGNSALDCAVFCDDSRTQETLENGLMQRYTEEAVKKMVAESTQKKYYRELFQDKMRPVLLNTNGNAALKQLRSVYSETLATNPQKRAMFDDVKYVSYTDFLEAGRLPKSSYGLTRRVTAGSIQDKFIIFMSYRWLSVSGDPGFDNPDDVASTQYRRMLRAVKLFLERHPNLDEKNVGIWLDWACVDQDDEVEAARGLAALSMSLTQCNAMISLIDDIYYQRAWCCVEVMMIQTLCKSYDAHLWVEHVIQPDGSEFIRNGPLNKRISMTDAKVTYESDRPKLLFLERQAKLLC